MNRMTTTRQLTGVLALMLGLAMIACPLFAGGIEGAAAQPKSTSLKGSAQTVQDCVDCPVMVVIPAGEFVMGSPPEEPQRAYWIEGPRRTVEVGTFALSQTPVTFAQWDACRLDGGCSQDPDDNGWGRADRPVINVSWEDAQEYLEWLIDKTGYDYRLPSEAEWEYAARAGTTGRFNTGDCIGPTQANFQGGAPATDCPGGEFRRQTLPVASFSANAWGLHDMHGNVWEWVQDCWNSAYFNAPEDGSAWMQGDCNRAVLRGGSWAIGGRAIRSAARAFDERDIRTRFRGFRVARPVEAQ